MPPLPATLVCRPLTSATVPVYAAALHCAPTFCVSLISWRDVKTLKRILLPEKQMHRITKTATSH